MVNGANCWNGGEFYGPPEANSLQLLNKYFTQYPEDVEKVVLNIKGGMDPATMLADGSEAGIKRSVETSLRLLEGKKSIDMFECARVDPKVDIETTIAALAKYVEGGKIGGIALSEVKAETIRRAVKIHPICAVEMELSLWETYILRNGVAATCAELGIPILAYSPLGKGLLTGSIKSLDDIPQDDMRRMLPRFSHENFPKNIELAHKVNALAEKKRCQPSQLALAWLTKLSTQKGMPIIIPIPGTITEARIIENSAKVELSDEDMEDIQKVLDSFDMAGERYPESMLHLADG